MMTRRRLTHLVTASIATAVALFGIARGSTAPLPYHDAGTARLRLSWSARPERIEVCRALSAEELAEREEHMRQRVECAGRFATYALRIETDGRVLDETVVRGAGLRHDRPLYLLRDFDLTRGVHHVRVSFRRRERTDGDTVAIAAAPRTSGDTGIFAGRAEREAAERTRRARAAIPAWLVLDTTLVLRPGRGVIVTFNADRKALEVLDGR